MIRRFCNKCGNEIILGEKYVSVNLKEKTEGGGPCEDRGSIDLCLSCIGSLLAPEGDEKET